MAGFDLPYIDITPYFNVALLGVDLLEWFGVIPDPIDLIIQAFQGRPREEATAQVSARLIKARNPAARLWGVALQRMLKEWDIVISSSSPGDQKILSLFYSQFVQNLVAQGVDFNRAKQIGLDALSTAAQEGAPLEKELTAPLPSGQTFNGPTSVSDTFQQGIDAGELRALKGQKLLNFAERYVWQHQPLNSLYKIVVGVPQASEPNFPVLPISDQTCPDGFTFDVKSGLCWIAPPITPPPPPGPGQGWPPPNPPPPPQPDRDGDELTDCCNTTALYLYYLATGLQKLAPADNSACCTEIVSAIGSIASALGNLVAPPPSGEPAPPPDFTPITDAIAKLTDAIGGLAPGAVTLDTAPIVDAIDRLANAPGSDNADLKRIADATETMVSEDDADDVAFIQKLVEGGALDASFAQVLVGQK